MDLTTLALIVVAGAGALAALRLVGGGRRTLNLRDPADQLIAVKRADFSPRAIMNRSEFKRFAWIDEWTRGRPYRLFTQVSYGEVIRSDDRDAHASVNSKRADFVLVDDAGMPACVIEYQGTGHHRGNAAARDKVKRAALAKAGVPLVELYPKQDRTAVIAAVEDALDA